jgi:hypothetical protein
MTETQKRWPTVRLHGIVSVCMVAPSGSRSLWIPPTTRPTVTDSYPSLILITRPTAICYLPAVTFLTFDVEPDQYLVAAVGPVGIRNRLIPRLGQALSQCCDSRAAGRKARDARGVGFSRLSAVSRMCRKYGLQSGFESLGRASHATARRLSKECGEPVHIFISTESSIIKLRGPGGMSGASSVRQKLFAM